MKGRDKRRRAKAAASRRAEKTAGFLITNCKQPTVVALMSPGACRKIRNQAPDACAGCEHLTC